MATKKLHAIWVSGQYGEIEPSPADRIPKVGPLSIERGSPSKITHVFGATYRIVDGKNASRSTGFFLHYAIPTPVIHEGIRCLARDFMIRYSESNSQELRISRIRLTDFNFGNFAGGIELSFQDKDISPTQPFLRLSMNDKPLKSGLVAQISITASKPTDATVSIEQLGLDYIVEQ